MNQKTLKGFAAALQLLILAVLFAVPLFSDWSKELLSVDNLSEILVLEFIAIVIGGFIVGGLFIPVGFSDNPKARWIAAALALLLLSPLTIEFWSRYGWVSVLLLLWLMFTTYGGVFISAVIPANRGRILSEIGLRWFFFVVLFSLLAAILDTPVSIEYWAGTEAGLRFGTLYFSIAAVLEAGRFFAKVIDALFHRINHTKP